MATSGQIQFNNPTIEHAQWEMLKNQAEKDREHKKEHEDELDSQVENEQKLDKLIASSNQFSFSIKTHMPFDLYPDELTVDIHKVSFIDVHILSKDVTSIPIRDINRVEVTNDFLFASIEIINGSQTTTISTSWLWKNEARQVQAIIQGLIVAYKNEINIEELPQDEILPKLQALGAPVV